jgi:steroid 5-alpha reductase family enzyme
VGFAFEAVGDWQLLRFRAQPAAAGAVLDTGLWRYTRHPNYFGETVLWWGFWLLALGGGAWWSLPAPLLMTILLLKVSGVTLLERDIAGRRPAYRDYVARTSAFLPWPPRPAVGSPEAGRG